MKRKSLLLCILVLLFGFGCSMPSIFLPSKEKINLAEKPKIVKPLGELIPKNSYQDRFQWEGYYFGKFSCPNCRGVEIWLQLEKINNRGEYVFREKFLGLKNRYSEGGLGWNKKGNIAKLMSNGTMKVALQKGFAYLLDDISKQKFLVRKVPVYKSKEGVFILDKSTIQHGLSQGNKTLKFRGIINFNKPTQEGYQSLKATYLFNCKKQTYDISRAAYYKNTFAMGKFIHPKNPNNSISPLIHTIAKKYCK